MFDLEELVCRILFLDQTLQSRGVMENDTTVEESVGSDTGEARIEQRKSRQNEPDKYNTGNCRQRIFFIFLKKLLGR